jgi:hypothetical protein
MRRVLASLLRHMTPTPNRRRFLRLASGLPLGLSGWVANGCGQNGATSPVAGTGPGAPAAAAARPEPAAPIVTPRVNGAVNLQPLRCLGCTATDATIDPALVALHLASAYELGFDGIRITAPLGDPYSLLAAIPYVRGARALGIDALVVLADFSGLTLARALHDSRRRPDVLRMYASLFAQAPAPVLPGLGGLGPGGTGRIAFQVLNEPTGFVGVPPEPYVAEILTPCFLELRAIDPRVIVVAAAEAGNRDGPPRVRAMLEAGLERVCDRIAYHVYSREVIPMLSDNVRQIVWVTESGTGGTANHLPWVRDVFPEIRARIGDVLRIFYFQLYDASPGVFRVLDFRREGGAYARVVEDRALFDYWTGEVAAAAGGRPLIPFSTLVPDIRLYFPTDEDRALLADVLAG